MLVSLYDKDYSNHIGYKRIHWTDINTYELTELELASHEYIMGLFDDDRFFSDELEFMDNALEILTKLSLDNEIIVCTIGTQENLRLKEEWINKNIPFCKFIGIDLYDYPDKSHINMSGNDTVFFDDVQKYLETSNARHKVLFGDNRWNETDHFDRVYNYYEVYDYIDRLKGWII